MVLACNSSNMFRLISHISGSCFTHFCLLQQKIYSQFQACLTDTVNNKSSEQQFVFIFHINITVRICLQEDKEITNINYIHPHPTTIFAKM